MDTTEITHLSLCSGYGGLDLGIKGVFGENVRTVAYAEIEAFAVECLLARMEGGQLDAAPIWPNLKSFPWEAFSDRVDILSGGYPCQPFSAAGKRLGTEDPRHLWPFIANGIRIMRPKLCFFENVEGHISLGLREVVGELESMGYQVSWGIFSAREVGAPHQRKRVFIMAYSADRKRKSLHDWNAKPTGAISCHSWPSFPGELQQEWEPPRVLGNPRNGLCESKRESSPREKGEPNGYASKSTYEKWIPNQPSLGGDADGTASGLDYAKLCISCDNRADELRLLGNGVVPATATKAFLTLLEDLIK
jgi:DNA (cytosine-5)-methyltransferase 1